MSAVIAVFPPGALDERRTLFDALSHAFSVRFEKATRNALQSARFALVLNGDADLLETVSKAASACYFVVRPADEGDAPCSRDRQVEFKRSDAVNIYLRGQRFREPAAEGLPPLPVRDDDTVLATSGVAPVWARRRTVAGFVDLVSTAPVELPESEVLRDHLFPEKFLRLLPLVQFLRDITSDRWQDPPLRACYIFDDPNLHGLSYGKIDYPRMAEHAKRHNYHAAMATVPLDAWWTNPKAARVFCENPERLSLLVHGNNHTNHELEQPQTDGEALRLLAQSLKRIATLEKSAGLSVSKVMVGPHGALNDAVMRAMLRLGFEGTCSNQSYLWRVNALRRLPLGGWRQAEFVCSLPVLVRKALYEHHEDIRFRAFLGLPIILYGHHQDAGRNMALLAENAAMVNALGEVRWLNPKQLMRSNFMTRREGDRLYVRMHSRRIELTAPDGIREVVLECPEASPPQDVEPAVLGRDKRFLLRPADGVLRSTAIPLDSSGTLHIRLQPPDAVDYRGVEAPATSLPVVARRFLAEARDRLATYL